MSRCHPDLPALLERVHQIGRDAIAPHAASVDADARFPTEAFAAFKEAKLLSCYVPVEHGGMGLSISDLSKICEAMGNYCGSTAMVFAMHQIQVGCIVHGALGSPYFQGVCRELVEKQLVLASATTEAGIGGDVRTSSCFVDPVGDRVQLLKQAPVISYALDSDAILVTARRSASAGPNDQVHVFVRRSDCTLEPLETWDTMGFRGTCSLGFVLRADVGPEQVLPTPYAEIHAKVMHSFAHAVWTSLWLGLANDAVHRARAHLKAQARKTPGTIPPNALRLAEVDNQLFQMRACVENTVAEYHQRLLDHPGAFPQDFAYSLRVNNLKVAVSKLLIEVVSGALNVTGIAGYRNDTKYSLSRHLRDAYGASLMVHNDRILGQSAPLQLMVRDV